MPATQAGQQADCCVGAKAATPLAPISAKGAAAVLRDTAARLEQAAVDLPRNAREVIGRFSPPDTLCECIETLDVRYIGRQNFDALKMLRASMTRNLAHFIAGKQEFDLVRQDDGFVPGSLTYPGSFPHPFTERYRARLHVFTPGELQALVERAIEVGRNSR